MAFAAGDSSRNSKAHSLLKFALCQVSSLHKNVYAISLSFIDVIQVFKYQAKESQLRHNLDQNILLEYSKQSSEANCLTNGETF